MRTDFEMMRELKGTYGKMEHERGMLNAKEISIIKETLEIDNRDILSLRNLRNFVVLIYDSWRRSADERTGDRYSHESMKLWDEMSAVTCVIDHAIYNKGGDV